MNIVFILSFLLLKFSLFQLELNKSFSNDITPIMVILWLLLKEVNLVHHFSLFEFKISQLLLLVWVLGLVKVLFHILDLLFERLYPRPVALVFYSSFRCLRKKFHLGLLVDVVLWNKLVWYSSQLRIEHWPLELRHCSSWILLRVIHLRGCLVFNFHLSQWLPGLGIL